MEKMVVLFGAGKDAEKIVKSNHLKIVAVIDNKKVDIVAMRDRGTFFNLAKMY